MSDSSVRCHTSGTSSNGPLTPSFAPCGDQWLQKSLTAGRDALGDAWFDKYLVSPIWNFAIAPGVCGEVVYASVLVPSLDRVGHYFPLAIVAMLVARRLARHSSPAPRSVRSAHKSSYLTIYNAAGMLRRLAAEHSLGLKKGPGSNDC